MFNKIKAGMLGGAGLLLAALPAQAIMINSVADVGDMFTVDFDGNIGTVDVAGLSGSAKFTYQGLTDFDLGGGETGNAYEFEVKLTNTSDGNLWTETRVAALGFDVFEVPEDGSVSGSTEFTAIVFDSGFPNMFGDIDVCVKGGQANNCQGGTGAGLFIGEMDTFTILLAYNPPPPASIELSNFGVRYQSLTSDGPINGVTYSGDSGTGSGGPNDPPPPTPVPEPGPLALIGTVLIGLGGLHFLRRRQMALV